MTISIENYYFSSDSEQDETASDNQYGGLLFQF